MKALVTGGAAFIGSHLVDRLIESGEPVFDGCEADERELRFVDQQPATVFGDGSHTRDYVHINDVVEARVGAGASNCEGAFNVGTGRQTSVLELVSLLSAVHSAPERPQFAPERVGEILRTAISPVKTQSELGWRAAVELEDGLTKTTAWVQAEAARQGRNEAALSASRQSTA